MKNISLIAFGLALFQSVWANGQQAVENSAVPYLLRLERLHSGQDVCVLVQRSGQYHLEQLNPYGVGIVEGELSTESLTSLETLLNKDGVFRLQQPDIRVPLIQGDLDELFVSILRPGRWQNVEFASAESRQPYDEFLNPLLTWLDELQKKKAKVLTEESGRNNCLPPKQIHLQTRTGEAISSMNAEIPEVKTGYILRTFTRHFDPSKIENRCVIIRDSGVYHIRRSQQARKETKTTVLDGKLSAEAINSLRGLIDAEGVRNWPAENPPLARLQAATVTYLSIPRAEAVQQIAVWKYVFPVIYDLGSIGANNLPRVDDHGTILIKPLDDWMKTNLPTGKEVPTSDPANPQCMPES